MVVTILSIEKHFLKIIIGALERNWSIIIDEKEEMNS
jgi:hypothetical protein